jgi:hypothetical protein
MEQIMAKKPAQREVMERVMQEFKVRGSLSRPGSTRLTSRRRSGCQWRSGFAGMSLAISESKIAG